MSRARLRIAALLCVVLVAGVLAACGDDGDEKATSGARTPVTSLQNTDTLEKTLASSISGSGGPDQPGEPTGPAVTTVECPASVTTGAGRKVDCDATGDDGLTGIVHVTFTDGSGAAYTYTAALETPDGRRQTAEGKVSGK